MKEKGEAVTILLRHGGGGVREKTSVPRLTGMPLRYFMDSHRLRGLLEHVREGSTSVDVALEQLRHMPFEDLGFAKVDHHRELRHGMPEVIFCKGKTVQQVEQIASALLARSENVLLTRATDEMATAIGQRIPEAEYFSLSGVVRVWRNKTVRGKGRIAAVCAGTSDLPVMEEAQLTAEIMGNEVDTIVDVGVAGIHRLLYQRDKLMNARVAIVCAGMEGALPSAVGGLVSCPVIAVPTSVGYGASFNGLAALLGMLNSCASNVTVVNIDNGFGAGYVASLINRL
jgi:NCAIR mutase (PurE)-related protein